jgi:hypothetical protein
VQQHLQTDAHHDDGTEMLASMVGGHVCWGTAGNVYSQHWGDACSEEERAQTASSRSELYCYGRTHLTRHSLSLQQQAARRKVTALARNLLLIPSAATEKRRECNDGAFRQDYNFGVVMCKERCDCG